MGYPEEDADSLELGSMPPLPSPHRAPSTQSPLSAISGRSSVERKQRAAAPTDDHDEEEMTPEQPAPAPVPHAHPLRGWSPQQENHRTVGDHSGVASRGAYSGGGGAAMMEHLSRPVRSRDVPIRRLDPTFLSRDRIAALARTANEKRSEEDDTLVIVPHSTRLLERRIEQVEHEQVEERPLGDDERRYAATEASQYRQHGYSGIDPSLRVTTGQPESALERARVRKVKKQVDAKWLQAHTDPALRPPGPLDRPDEMAFYDSVYQVTMQELMDEGILFDEHDRKNAFNVTLHEWDDLASDKRGTTGLCGSCFDEWSFS